MMIPRRPLGPAQGRISTIISRLTSTCHWPVFTGEYRNVRLFFYQTPFPKILRRIEKKVDHGNHIRNKLYNASLLLCVHIYF